jgi:hypothetical protein
LINANWETTDLSTLTAPFNDNVPTDDQSAYSFDSIDVQYLERGDNPSYEITAAVFGSEADALYTLAKNERTQSPVDMKIHFGQPGNRFTILAPYTKIKFQQQRLGFVGALNKSTIQIAPTPFKNGATNPVAGEAYLAQSTAFLTT